MNGAHVHTFKAALSQVAEWYPEEPALVQADPGRESTVTYRELDDRARRLANGLAGLGVEKGDRVAVLSRTTIEHAVTFFAALKLGAIPATLHWRDPVDTAVASVDRIGASVLVRQAGLVDYGPRLESSCASLEAVVSIGDRDPGADRHRYESLLEGSAAREPEVDLAPEDPGFINFSSGTTALPKPVLHSQRNLVESAHLGGLRFRLSREDRYLVYATPSFSAWAMVVLPTVNLAATAVFLERWDPQTCLDVIEAHGVTITVMAPTLWRQLLAEDLESRDLSSLDRVGYSAEPMSPDLFDQVRRRFAPKVFTAYGTTETLGSSVHLHPEDVTAERLASIGRPGPNVDVRLIEPDSKDPGRPVPAGETGEIILRGPSVSDEIWGDEEATAESFDEAGWFFTGDLAYRDPDGFLYLKGRSKNMIISGGINIHPESVEKVLASHPLVKDCAVIGVPDEQWGEAVKALVVPEDRPPTAEELDEFCRSSPALSDFQRPKAYEIVDSLPKTGTGKLDRSRLGDAGG